MIKFVLIILSIFPNEDTITASWYGEKWNGRVMANGEIYDMTKNTAAYNKVPLGTKLRVYRARDTSRFVDVIVTDRVSKQYSHRIDLSKSAFSVLGKLKRGLIKVKIETMIINETEEGE